MKNSIRKIEDEGTHKILSESLLLILKFPKQNFSNNPESFDKKWSL